MYIRSLRSSMISLFRLRMLCCVSLFISVQGSNLFIRYFVPTNLCISSTQLLSYAFTVFNNLLFGGHATVYIFVTSILCKWIKSKSFLDVTELLLFISLPQYNFLSIIHSCYYLETTSLKHTNKYSNKNDYGKLVTYKNHTEYDSGWVYNYLHGYAGALQS